MSHEINRGVIDKHKHLLRTYAKNVKLISDYSIQSNKGLNMIPNVWDNNSHAFMVEYESIAIEDELDQRKMFALLNAMKKGAVHFYWSVPLLGNALRGTNGTAGALVANSKVPGDQLIRMKGANHNGELVNVGDIIRLDFHSKCYQVLDCEYKNDPAITLNTPLVKSVSTTDKLITREPEMRLRMDPDGDPTSYLREAGDLDAGFSCTFLETMEV